MYYIKKMNFALNPILNQVKKHSRRYSYQYIIMALCACVLLLINTVSYNVFTQMSYVEKGMIFSLLALIVFKLRGKIIFFAALCSLSITFILFVSGNQDASEAWSMAVYGFLVLGIAALLFENREDFN